MTNYPESGIKLVADTVDYTQSMTDAIFLADYLDSYGTISLTVDADASEAVNVLADLPLSDEAVNFTVDATLTGDTLPVDGETADITVDASLGGDELPKDGERTDIDVDATLSGDELPVQGDTTDIDVDATLTGDTLPVDGDTIDSTVNTTVQGADGNSGGILDTLVAIKHNQQFKIALDVTGTALDFISAVGKFSAGPLVELDNELAKIKATTGEALPGARELISKIFYSDLGESITQVGDLVAQAHAIGAPLEEATTASLNFTKTFADQNPKEVMNTLNQMVRTGLAPSFSAASDMLVTAFQKGANRGGDLLQTINNNASALKDMGETGESTFSRIIKGLDGGFKSANDVVSAIIKIKQNSTSAAGKDNDTSKALETLGVPNPAESGKAWTDDFITGVITAINNYKGTDTEKQALLSAIIGGKMGAKDYSAVMSLNDSDAAAVFAPVKGAAAIAAGQMDDSLGGAIKDFELAAQGAATDFLSSKQLDLPGKMDKLKKGLQDGLDVLAKGGDLSDALTVALKPIGFDTAFQGLESMLGNFVIAILQAVSTLQSLDPKNWAAKAGTDATINKMGATQLTYDLKISNPDQVAGDIGTAISRGVSPDQISKSVGTAVNELIAAGQPALAKSLLDSVKNVMQDANANLELTPSGSPVNVDAKPVVSEGDLAEYQATIDKAMAKTANNSIVLAQNTMTDVFTPVKTGMDGLKDTTTQTNTHVKNVTDATRDLGSTSTKASNAIGGANYTVTASADIATVSLTNMSVAIGDVNTAAGGLNAAASHVADVQGTLNGTGGGSGAGLGTHAAGGQFVGTGIVGDAGPEIVSNDMGLAVLNNATTERLMAALQSYIPGGSFSKVGGNSYSVVNNNIVPNVASADALGYRTAEQLRGMG